MDKPHIHGIIISRNLCCWPPSVSRLWENYSKTIPPSLNSQRFSKPSDLGADKSDSQPLHGWFISVLGWNMWIIYIYISHIWYIMSIYIYYVYIHYICTDLYIYMYMCTHMYSKHDEHHQPGVSNWISKTCCLCTLSEFGRLQGNTSDWLKTILSAYIASTPPTHEDLEFYTKTMCIYIYMHTCIYI